jgi:hypothetical protein
MIDIQSYFMSLKASWVSRLVSNQLFNWKVIPCKYFAKLGKEWLVFSQNLDNITVNKYAKQIPIFYGAPFQVSLLQCFVLLYQVYYSK